VASSSQVIKEITIAAFTGRGPGCEPGLRTAISAAVGEHAGLDIERALKRGTGEAASTRGNSVRGLRPGGVALLVGATDNNRTAVSAAHPHQHRKMGEAGTSRTCSSPVA
jgi:transcriptional/translational regulatory protein YebC/TACO1